MKSKKKDAKDTSPCRLSEEDKHTDTFLTQHPPLALRSPATSFLPGKPGDLWQMLLALALMALVRLLKLIEVCSGEGRHNAGRARRCRTQDQLFTVVRTMFALSRCVIISPNTCYPVISADIAPERSSDLIMIQQTDV